MTDKEISPVRWGVLGCARVFERRMVPGFAKASNAELVAVSSRSEEKAQAVAAKHSVPRWFGSYEALLEDPEIDAVYIPLPNDLHYRWTVAAIEAGKHVLCDKPGALTASGAMVMALAAEEKNVRLMEGFMYRHHPQHARIHEIVQSGEIGEVVTFRGAFAYLTAPDPENIRWQRDSGGGAFLDVGVYPLNASRWFMGEPEAVIATARFDAKTAVDIHTTVLLEYPDGRTAVVESGFDQAFTTRYEVVGTLGTVTAERAFKVDDLDVAITVRTGDNIRTEIIPHVDQYALEIEHFSRCIQEGTPLAPGEDGALQARVVEAVGRSLEERERVEV